MKLVGPIRRVFLNSLALALLIACVFFAALYIRTHAEKVNSLAANVSSAEVVDLTNENRKAAGVPALRTSPLLTEAAQRKADDMAARSYYAHVSPDGKSPLYWLDLVGYVYINAGENLVIDRTTSEQVLSAWMLSTDHRENILRPQFTEVGVGTAEGEYKGLKTIYVVEEFGTPAPIVMPPIPVSKKEVVVVPTLEIKTLTLPEKPLVLASTSPREKTFQDLIPVTGKIAVSAATSTVATTSGVAIAPLLATSENKPVDLPATKDVRAASYAPEGFYESNTSWMVRIYERLKKVLHSLY